MMRGKPTSTKDLLASGARFSTQFARSASGRSSFCEFAPANLCSIRGPRSCGT